MQPIIIFIQFLINGLYTGDILQNTTLRTRRRAIEAYEHHTGFYGLGDFLKEQGLITIVDEELSCAE